LYDSLELDEDVTPPTEDRSGAFVGFRIIQSLVYLAPSYNNPYGRELVSGMSCGKDESSFIDTNLFTEQIKTSMCR